jgi:hypothetical protein
MVSVFTEKTEIHHIAAIVIKPSPNSLIEKYLNSTYQFIYCYELLYVCCTYRGMSGLDYCTRVCVLDSDKQELLNHFQILLSICSAVSLCHGLNSHFVWNTP